MSLRTEVMVVVYRRAGGKAGKKADDHDGNAELQAEVPLEQAFNLPECE